MGKWLMIIGALVLLVGAALQFAPWLVNWFGRLPGDLRFGSGNTHVFIPLTSMILVSIILTVIVNLFRH
jgi:hypothetical protein